jgi:hypothetical protein
MPKLTCKSVMFYSETDELSFFNWINNIKCIKKFEGVSDTLFLHINTTKPSDICLRELIALFHRYKVDMEQLSQFLNDKNKSWFFENKRTFWHKKIFKNSKL